MKRNLKTSAVPLLSTRELKMNSVKFNRWLVIVNGLVPLLMLAWDAYYGQLGANPVNYALHVTGILSLVFLFLTLLITPLRWVTGWGGWIAFRRALGLFGFFYAVVHAAIYVAFDRELSISSTISEIWLRRFLQVGTLAVCLMIPLAITSTNSMIQKLGPKRWKLLHRLVYIVAALGVAHYYLLVKSDVRQPVAFALVLTGLLGARVGKRYFDLRQSAQGVPYKPAKDPVASSKSKIWKGELSVTSITQVTSEVKTFRLTAKTGGRPFEHLPGQYMSLQLMIDGKRVNRCYSIASSPTLMDACELTIKRHPDGLVSRHLHDTLKVGDTIVATAPMGKFVFTGDESRAILMIAGGVGITPLMSVARYLTDRAWDGAIYFVVVTRTESDIVFREELDGLSKRFPNFRLCITLTQVSAESSWPGHRGFLSEVLLQNFVGDLRQLPVFLCGPIGMMEATQELLLKCGVSSDQIKTEDFSSPVAARSESAAEQPKSVSGVSRITFSRSKQVIEIDSEATVLEAAEASAIELPFECRSGICGQCKTRLLSGAVVMDSEDALTVIEKTNGWILACQAHATSDLVVDA